MAAADWAFADRLRDCAGMGVEQSDDPEQAQG
jgi:hypothetical protein